LADDAALSGFVRDGGAGILFGDALFDVGMLGEGPASASVTLSGWRLRP
jgi:hypothetical protein